MKLCELQTISRQLYAILVLKLDGKALGIVQLVGKGEGATFSILSRPCARAFGVVHRHSPS